MEIVSVKLALRSLRRAKVRSLLMGLGISLGVLAIMLTIATGEGTRRAIQRSFRAMIGSLDVLLVLPGGPAQRGMATMQSAVTTLVPADADALASVPNVAAVGSEQSQANTPIQASGKDATTFLFGASPNWRAIRGDSVVAGRFYSDDEDRAMARVIVLGSDVAQSFFGSPTSAVGQVLRVNGIAFQVIGVLAPNGAGPGGVSIDNLVYIPVRTSSRRVFNRDYLSTISLKLRDASRWAETQRAVERLLRERHAIVGTALSDFRVSSPEAMIARVANVDTTLRRSLLWVGVLGMLIGGAVIANLMFAAVLGRRREIAIRRAVGATRAHIGRQFWTEALLVAGMAAVIGELAALLLIGLGAQMMRVPMVPSWALSLGALGASMVIGAAAGLLPARRAAALHPAAALRDA
jgi:macrolide transport system ATP-binding/permease protein